jgi:two-component system sensor histidine kinase RpfC
VQNLTILLAEDNGVNRKVLDKILTAAGCRVTLAADGAEALDLLLREDFDLVLMDVNMPRINGVEVAQLYGFAKPAAGRAPILGLTADASEACRAQCLQAGMVEIVTKPVEAQTLLRAIEASVLADLSRPAPSQESTRAAEREICALHQPSLDALAALGGREFIREVAVQFVIEGAQIVDRLSFAIELVDLAGFLREAHALSSSSGNLGAFGLAALCRSWRDVDATGLAREGEVYLAALRRQWAATNRALRPYLAAPAQTERLETV